jgi:hypothetical protein
VELAPQIRRYDTDIVYLDHVARPVDAFTDAVAALVRHVDRDTPQRHALSLCTIDKRSRRQRYLDYGFQDCNRHPEYCVFLFKAAVAVMPAEATSGQLANPLKRAPDVQWESRAPQRIAK